MTTAPFIDHYLVLGLPTGEDGIRLVDTQIIEAYNAKRSQTESAAAAIESSFGVLMDAEKRHDFNNSILDREMERKFARQKKRRQLASQKLQEKITDRKKQPAAARGTKRKNNIQETEANKRQALIPTVDRIAEAASVMFAAKKYRLKTKTKTRILAKDESQDLGNQGGLFQGWPQFSPPKTQLFQGWPKFNPPPKTQGCGELFQGWPLLSPRIA